MDQIGIVKELFKKIWLLTLSTKDLYLTFSREVSICMKKWN